MSLGCVVLAAGNGSRFGKNKLSELFRGKPLIQWALEAVPTDRLGPNYADVPAPVCVVTQYLDVGMLATAFGFAGVYNQAPELGISHSVVLGTQALMHRCGGLMFLVGDQPLLRRETCAALADRFLADPTRIVVPAAGDRQGNPCIFPAVLYPELLALTGDRGGKQIINRHPELVVEVQVPEEELYDVDRAADLEKLLL